MARMLLLLAAAATVSAEECTTVRTTTVDPRCVGVECAPGYKCAIYDADCDLCFPSFARCAPINMSNACQGHTCPFGQVCANIQPECKEPPCDPFPLCLEASDRIIEGCDRSCRDRALPCPTFCLLEKACDCYHGYYLNEKGRCVFATEC